jgi:hypothetical protein
MTMTWGDDAVTRVAKRLAEGRGKSWEAMSDLERTIWRGLVIRARELIQQEERE